MPDPTTRSIELNQIQVSSEPITSPDVPQTNLETLLGGEGEISFSNAGANGAILVRSNGASSGGAAIKLEGSLVGQRVEKSAKLMDDFFQNANGPAPFVAPRVFKVTSTDLDGNVGTLEQISGVLEQRRGNNNANRVDRFQKKLNEVPEGESDIMVMELAKGKQINEISTDDKIALYKSEEFAKTLGRSLPVMMGLRLNDHLGSGDPMCFKNNVSNMMFDVESGQLSVIDFDVGFQQNREHEKLLRIGPPLSAFKPAEMVGDLNQFVTDACSTPEKFQEALDKMVNGENTPLKGLMDAFTNERDNELSLFSNQENERVEGSITLEDKRRFAANLLVGVVDGMEYMQQNEEALRQAVLNSHEEVEINGETRKLEHFYNEQELNEYTEQVRQLDTQTLKQRVRNLAKGAPEVRMDGLTHDIEANNRRLAEIAERITALKGEVLGSTRHRNEIDQLRLEQTNINEALKESHKTLNDIINREEVSRVMSQQTPQVHVEVQEEVQVDVPNVERVPSVRDLLRSQSNKSLNTLDEEMLNRVEDTSKENLEEISRGEDLGEVSGEKIPVVEQQVPIGGLTDQEKEKLRQIESATTRLEGFLAGLEDLPRKVATMRKLDTRGQVPDLSTFTDQELRDIFELASQSPVFNHLDLQHPYSTANTQTIKSTDLTREQLEEFTHTILQAQNYSIDANEISSAQITIMNSAGRGISEQSSFVRDTFNDLKKQVEDREGVDTFGQDELGTRVRNLRENIRTVARQYDEMANEYARQAPTVGLEYFASQGMSAQEVAREIGNMTHRTGGTDERLDVRGANLTGLDISESDLSGLEIDAETLSRATGIETAAGLDEKLKAKALELKPLVEKADALKQKQDRLQNKPTIGDRFRALLRHGHKGIDGELARIEKKLDILKKATSETLSGATLDDRREYIQTLKVQTLALNQKIGELEGETTARVLDYARGKGGEVNKEKWDQAVEKLAELRPIQDEMLKKIKTEEKILKVRESVGEKHDAPTQGHGHRQGI